MTNQYIFSVIIIGYNTSTALKQLLLSINNIQYNAENIEIIYIDDGSKDNSVALFQNYNLKFQKQCFSFTKNKGRGSARNKGIELSSGKWLLFLNSNVIVGPHIIQAYQKVLKQGVIAAGGAIKYETKNINFQNYLNNSLRGINQYQQNDIIKYNYLLFSNCVVKQSALKTIKFNCDLISYGGEELELSYRLEKKYPQQFVACLGAVVTRINHPDLLYHCKRLENFGGGNFKKLNFQLQRSIVKYPFLIKRNIILKYCIYSMGSVFITLYRCGLQYNKIIQIILLIGILRGVHDE